MADKNKKLPKSISSIEDCLKIVGDLRKKARSSKKIFYRGHGRVGWDLTPALFRKDVDSSQEKRILQEMTSRKSLDFSVDQNMFERLVRAQHYGLPTRLLDVTLSPLIALFFTCSSNEEKDGELITIASEKSEIKYCDSHTVSCLANLANLSKDEKEAFILLQHKIPQTAKTKILEQLDWLGINESFIYPELEKLSGHLLKEMKREKEG